MRKRAGAGHGRAGQGGAGRGRAGHCRAGQGRAGQGRAGQGRAAQGVLSEGVAESFPSPFTGRLYPHRAVGTLGRGPRSEPRAPMQMVSGALGRIGFRG